MKYEIGKYDNLIQRFINWGQEVDDIEAILLVGSRAYDFIDVKDQWSDIDLAIYTVMPELYLHNPNLLSKVYPLELSYITDFFGHQEMPVIRAQFKDHLEADIGFFPVDFLFSIDIPDYSLLINKRGVKVLLDKNERLANANRRLQKMELEDLQSMDADDLIKKHNLLAINVIHTAKKILRDNYVEAYMEISTNITVLLLEIMISYVEIRYGRILLPTGNFKNIRFWGDDFVNSLLKRIFPSCEKQSLINALYASLGVMKKLSTEISKANNFDIRFDSLNYAKNELLYFGLEEKE